MVAVVGAGVIGTGCSSPAGPSTPSPTHASPAISPSMGPCASLTTTTSIDEVPVACAALWAPYNVTKVPPPNILQLEHVPPAPKVVNRTNGAVSDATAQLWANAANANSGWLKWAEAYDQPGFLIHLTGPELISKSESSALASGATISLPDCDLYPTSYVVFVVGPDGLAYFQRKGLPADDPTVLVATYEGPCASKALYPDGHTETIIDDSAPTIAFVPGRLRNDQLLGAIWYADAGGSCGDAAGPPQEWCGR